MRELFEALDSTCLSERSELRDDKGRLTGIMLARPNGDVVLRDHSHMYMGSFNARRNETRDRRGKLIGKGNVLSSLIKEGALGQGLGSDSSNSGGGHSASRAPSTRPAAGPARGGSTPPARNPNPTSRANTPTAGRGMTEGWFETFVSEL